MLRERSEGSQPAGRDDPLEELPRSRLSRIFEHLLGRPLFEYPTLVEEAHAIGDVSSKPHLVRLTFVEPHRRDIVAFTGHAYIMTELSPWDLDDLQPDGFGRALDPSIQIRVARGGEIGVNDVTLAWRRSPIQPGAAVELTTDHDDHPRVRHARAIRDDVRVYAGVDGLVTVSDGLAGRPEMSVEVWRPGGGRGRSLIRAAQSLSPSDVVYAAVAPGNARSLRAFLAEGFQPLASEVIIRPGAGSVANGRDSRKVVASDDRR